MFCASESLTTEVTVTQARPPMSFPPSPISPNPGLGNRAVGMGAGPRLVVAHIPNWLWQPRAPEPGWNQDSSLQALGLRHPSALGQGRY